MLRNHKWALERMRHMSAYGVWAEYSLIRLNSWIPDFWFFAVRFCPIPRSQTFTSSQSRGCSDLEPRHKVNQLCSRKSWSKPLLSWTACGSVVAGAMMGPARGYFTIPCTSVSSKVSQMRSFLRNPTSGVQSAMFSCAHLPLITWLYAISIWHLCGTCVFQSVYLHLLSWSS